MVFEAFINELTKIGMSKEFIERMAKGEADPDAYAPAGRLFAKLIFKYWERQDSQTPSD